MADRWPGNASPPVRNAEIKLRTMGIASDCLRSARQADLQDYSQGT